MSLRTGPRPEESRADPHERCALFHGGFEVAAHAHRHRVEPGNDLPRTLESCRSPRKASRTRRSSPVKGAMVMRPRTRNPGSPAICARSSIIAYSSCIVKIPFSLKLIIIIRKSEISFHPFQHL